MKTALRLFKLYVAMGGALLLVAAAIWGGTAVYGWFTAHDEQTEYTIGVWCKEDVDRGELRDCKPITAKGEKAREIAQKRSR